jgi:hypothetical protein
MEDADASYVQFEDFERSWAWVLGQNDKDGDDDNKNEVFASVAAGSNSTVFGSRTGGILGTKATGTKDFMVLLLMVRDCGLRSCNGVLSRTIWTINVNFITEWHTTFESLETAYDISETAYVRLNAMVCR